jgi:hypothetical protein
MPVKYKYAPYSVGLELASGGKILSNNEMFVLNEENAFVRFKNTYWPRWFRNSMVQVIETIRGLERTKEEPMASWLSALSAYLRQPNALCYDIGILEKLDVCRLYTSYIRPPIEMSQISPDILSIAGDTGQGPFSYINSEDIFATASGQLVTPLEEALRAIFEELLIPMSYSTSRGSDFPLTLYAPTYEQLFTLRSRLPAEFNVFCSFEVSKDDKANTEQETSTNQ